MSAQRPLPTSSPGLIGSVGHELALRISGVIVASSLLTAAYVYQQSTATELTALEHFAQEEAERESASLRQTERQLTGLLDHTLAADRTESLPPGMEESEFHQRFSRGNDGAFRRRSDLPGDREADAFLIAALAEQGEARREALRLQTQVSRFALAWGETYHNVFLADLDGIAATYWPGVESYRDTPADFRLGETPWAQAAGPERNPERRPVWSAPWFDWVSKGWYVSCFVPRDQGGRPHFVAGAALPLNDWHTRIRNQKPAGAYNLVMRADGQLIAHSDPEIMASLRARHGEFFLQESGDPQLKAIYDALHQDFAGQASIEEEQSGLYLGVASIPGPDWYWITAIPARELNRPGLIRAALVLGVGLAALGLVLVWVMALIKGRYIAPLQQLVGEVTAFGKGKLDARVPANLTRQRDELGRLGRAFNRMADSLAQTTREVNGYARALEQKVQERTQELAAKEQAKTRFLAAASHDLRQPMQAINLFLDVLRRSGLSPSQSRTVDHLELSTRALGELLDTLLDISKLDSGTVQPVCRSVPLMEFIERIEAEFAPIALSKGLRFKLAFPLADLRLYTDAKLLSVVLRNLVANAIKYTERGGVLLGIRRRRSRVLIQVWDTGVGIRKRDLAHIYEEFFQANNPHRDRSQGLGLGLSIAQRTLTLLESKLVCRSRRRHGTVFEFLVPLTQEDPYEDTLPGIGLHVAEAHPMPPLPTPYPHNPYTPGLAPTPPELALEALAGAHILIVEDDRQVATAWRLWLNSRGALVHVFPSAEEALESPVADHATYVISDLALCGKLSGLEFLLTLKRRPGKLPFRAMLVTGTPPGEFVETAATEGWPVLFKPVGVTAVVTALMSPLPDTVPLRPPKAD